MSSNSATNKPKWDIADISDAFNKLVIQCIKIVMAVTSVSTKSQTLIETIRRRINIVIKADPFFLLENIGKYLFRYRDVISSNIDEFVENPDRYILSEHKQELSQSASNFDENQITAFKGLIDILKNQWKEYSESEKKKIRKIIQSMLSNYCKYLMVQNKN